VIKGGLRGARIFERSYKKTRSVFLQKEELAWLARIVEKLAVLQKPEVFWDHSRAGFPRIMAQKCSNRNGRFLTVEEFDGRRKCGSIMVPEGRFGQGWEGFISEVRWANSSLCGVRVTRDDKLVKEASGRRSYAEVLGWSSQPVEECFNASSEPIARVPRWLKEASDEMDKQVRESGKCAQNFKKTLSPAMMSTRAQAKEGVCKLKASGLSRKLQTSRLQAEVSSSVLLKGPEGSDRNGQLLLNARLELLLIKESLEKVRREADVGLERLESVANIMENCGLGLGFKAQQKLDKKGKEILEGEDVGGKPSRAFKPKKKKLVFRPKVSVGLDELIKGGKPISTQQAVLCRSVEGRRMCLAESSGGMGTSTVASSASLGLVAPLVNGKSVGDHLGIPGLKTGVLGSSSSTLLVPERCRVEAGESSGGRGQSEKPQIAPIETPGGLGFSLERGALPAMGVVGVGDGDSGGPIVTEVAGEDMEVSGGLGFSEKAVERSAGGGLAVKESSDGLDSPVGSGGMPMTVAVSTGGSAGDLGESEMAGYALTMPFVVNQSMEEEFHCHGITQMALTTCIVNDECSPGCLDKEQVSGYSLKLPISDFLNLGGDSGGYQGGENKQNSLASSSPAMVSTLVPWVSGELSQDGDQEMITCSTPVTGPTGCWIGSAGAVESERGGKFLKNLGGLGRRGREEDSGRHVPLKAYDPNSGLEAGYSDWVTQCASEIYPIVGISYVGHKLQLLALLTFLEGEHRKDAMGSNSRGGVKGRREVKNLESSVNYDGKGASSSRGKRKGRGSVVIL
jgi:hypothetical protein